MPKPYKPCRWQTYQAARLDGSTLDAMIDLDKVAAIEFEPNPQAPIGHVFIRLSGGPTYRLDDDEAHRFLWDWSDYYLVEPGGKVPPEFLDRDGQVPVHLFEMLVRRNCPRPVPFSNGV